MYITVDLSPLSQVFSRTRLIYPDQFAVGSAEDLCRVTRAFVENRVAMYSRRAKDSAHLYDVISCSGRGMVACKASFALGDLY